MEKIDSLDKKIMGILSKNARMPFKDVAAECGVSRAAIHQRVQHLVEAGVIVGSSSSVGIGVGMGLPLTSRLMRMMSHNSIP